MSSLSEHTPARQAEIIMAVMRHPDAQPALLEMMNSVTLAPAKEKVASNDVEMAEEETKEQSMEVETDARAEAVASIRSEEMTGTATRQTRHNNALLNLLSSTHYDVANDPINENAFYYNKSTGNFKGCNEVAASRSERNARGAIVNAILKAGTRDHQRLTLRNALTDRRIRDLVVSLGLNMEEMKVAIHIMKNVRKVYSVRV